MGESEQRTVYGQNSALPLIVLLEDDTITAT